eukprot:CAMPEP_0172008614 /NCGR_PEP_ID=MMETSP1041-20130122/6741_1 /TAXON_ID=464988 /ORGANISM="Hemiselmis andersenii, Strain CCMP439" /LENGTH=80 /DNA_ID=CAMNT_0012662821 /DNA_START=557 /DNA_END=795 /DNA_ORIENTATION=+
MSSATLEGLLSSVFGDHIPPPTTLHVSAFWHGGVACPGAAPAGGAAAREAAGARVRNSWETPMTALESAVAAKRPSLCAT